MYVDSHCHLDDPAFDADRDAVIERARAAGLAYLLTIGGAAGLSRNAKPGSPIVATNLSPSFAAALSGSAMRSSSVWCSEGLGEPYQ